jgi:hypothetical protein
MNSGKYRGLSCEFYDGPDQAEIPEPLRRGAKGLILKRVSLLGGHPPRCKGLGCPPWKAGDPPAESRAWASGECEWTPDDKDARYTFADPVETPAAVDREQLMAVIKQAGFGEDFSKTLSDQQASTLVADIAGRALAALGGGNNDGGKGPMSKEQLISELQKLGQDPQALSQMSEPALQELYKHLSAAKGQPAAGTTMGDRGGGTTTQPVPLSLGTVREYAEAAARTEVHRQRAPDRQRTVKDFCDRMIRDGKMTPADADEKTGATRKRLERAAGVMKFGEGPSELEEQMAEIEARPPAQHRFGEKIPDRDNAGSQADTAYEAKLKAHYEQRGNRFKGN